MKKLLFSSTLILLSFNFAYAQKEDMGILSQHNVAIGIGYWSLFANLQMQDVTMTVSGCGLNYTSTQHRRSPLFSANYEQILKKKLGIGYLGIGAEVFYQRASTKLLADIGGTNNIVEQYDFNHYGLAPFAAYHFSILHDKKMDVFAGVALVQNIIKHKETHYFSPGHYSIEYKESFLHPNIIGGIRKIFGKHLGVGVQVGYPYNFLRLIASLHL